MEVSTQARGKLSTVGSTVEAGTRFSACCDTPSGAMMSNTFKFNSRPFVDGELATPGRNATAGVEEDYDLSGSK